MYLYTIGFLDKDRAPQEVTIRGDCSDQALDRFLDSNIHKICREYPPHVTRVHEPERDFQLFGQ